MKPLKQPTNEDLKALLKKHEITRQKAADLLHVSVSAVHSWTAPNPSVKYRQMPFGYWELLLLKLGAHPTHKLLAK